MIQTKLNHVRNKIDVYIWHLYLTFMFDIYIWHLYFTFTFDVYVCHLCLTFMFDIYIWHLCLTFVCCGKRSEHSHDSIWFESCWAPDDQSWHLYLKFIFGVYVCHLYVEFVFEFYIWHLHLTFIFDIYIRHLWCLIFRRLHLTFSFEEQHDRCVPKIGFWVFFFWNFALRLISV